MTACRSPADHAPLRAAALLLLLSAVAAGCTSSDYLKVRKVPSNPLAGPLQLLSRQGPQPSDRTHNLLQRYDLAAAYKDDAADALLALGREIEAEPTAEKIYAYAELSYVSGKKAEALGQRAKALDLFGASVAHSYSAFLRL